MALVDSFDGFIFDYGGVLVHHQTEEDQARMAAIAGIPQDQFAENYWAYRLHYDKGLLDGAEYWQQVAQAAGKTLSLHQVEAITELDCATWMNFDESMWDWVAQLRAGGKRTAVLSNMPKDLGVTIKSRTERFSGFDHVTLSYEVKSAKPEPDIYEDCLRGIRTPANKTIFFDDRVANVQGAELLGMRAIEFNDRDAVLRQMLS